MNLLDKAKAMLGFKSRNDERPVKDPIRADVTRALQANERASYNAQKALEELLSRNDRIRGAKRDG